VVQPLVKTNDKNEIIIDAVGRTSCPGIFAAGDVTSTPYKQAIIAAGDGARAALEAYNYLLCDDPGQSKRLPSDWSCVPKAKKSREEYAK
jgi:alkyl hydroperoxide reductase subunit AhpF